jgi:amidase
VTELHDLTALEQAAAVRAGDVSSLELTDHYLARIDKLSDTVGAFITVTADLAREQARELDIEVRRGELRSPLHGVPVPVKDLNLTAGVRTTFGSTVFAESVPDVDDHVVSLLRDAGTVLLGKTNTPEFGLPCYTENAVAPPARTPWDLERKAGGSSGELPRRLPQVTHPLRTATTAVALCAFPRAAADWWVSSPPEAGSAAGRSRVTCRGCRSRGCWPAR